MPDFRMYFKRVILSLVIRIFYKIGFLRSDHATQTDESEIPEIKSLTSTVQELVTELGYIKKDLHFSKRVIIAKYNKKLENTALKLHTQLQER